MCLCLVARGVTEIELGFVSSYYFEKEPVLGFFEMQANYGFIFPGVEIVAFDRFRHYVPSLYHGFL